MRTISFVHVADLHLGEPIKGWKWDKGQVWIRQEEHLQTFERIITFVQEKSVPFLLIAGDFLEHGFVTTNLYRFVYEQFERIPDTRVFISPGNHDPNRLDSIYQQETWPENVYIFAEYWETLFFPSYQLYLSGRGFADFSDRQGSLPSPTSDESHHIYLVHGDFREEQSNYFPILEHELYEHQVDYVALGHIHKRQTYQLKNKKRTTVHYPGSPEARNWKEVGKRFLTYGTIDQNGVLLEDVPIQTRIYEQVAIDITNVELTQVIQLVQEEIEARSDEDYFWVQLVGRSAFGTDDIHWLSKLESKVKMNRKWVFVEDQSLPDYDLDHLRNQQTLKGTFIQIMEMRIAKETDEKKRRVLQAALYWGLDAMEKELVVIQ